VVRRIIESFGIVPGDNFADNYRQLVALRGGRRGVAPRRVLFALLLFQADFGLKGHGGITCGMKSGACAMA
jgi:hypothetical protein